MNARYEYIDYESQGENTVVQPYGSMYGDAVAVLSHPVDAPAYPCPVPRKLQDEAMRMMTLR